MKEEEEPESKIAGKQYPLIVRRTHGLSPAVRTGEIPDRGNVPFGARLLADGFTAERLARFPGYSTAREEKMDNPFLDDPSLSTSNKPLPDCALVVWSTAILT